MCSPFLILLFTILAYRISSLEYHSGCFFALFNNSFAALKFPCLYFFSLDLINLTTLANAYQAINNDHEIVPVLNKIDLPSSEPDRIKDQIEEILGIDSQEAALVSAKTGDGIKDLLEKIIKKLPSPSGNESDPLK